MRAVAVAAVLAVILFLFATALVRQPIPIWGASTPRAASSDRLRRDVQFLTATVRPRDAAHTANLDASADYIARQFASAGARVTVQKFGARRGRFKNVIAELGPATVEPVLVIGAHYDAFSVHGDFPGADDNASGTAALLELVRVLGGRHLRHPVVLVAYANEEPPFFGSDEMGSAVHARSLQEQHRRVAGMICLER